VTTILWDEDFTQARCLTLAMEAVEAALRAKITGELVAPPRQRITFPEHGELVFTTGGVVGARSIAGFRAYGSFNHEDAPGAQVVAVWNAHSGALEGLVVGHRLAKLRMGAIGGLAIRHMALADAARVAVIGAGPHARAQLEAAVALRPIREATVYSRSEDGRRAFAAATTEQLAIPVTAAGSARAAVEHADIVITATTSSEPVISATWLKDGAHVNMIGPKTTRRAELGVDVAERARVIATDSLEQADTLEPPFFLYGSRCRARIVELAQIVAGSARGRLERDDITLFCAVGLAGTEVAIADALLRAGKPE
jgi:alanine dehydrogenase